MSCSTFPAIQRNWENLPLSTLKKNAQLKADLLAQGLATAPNLSSTAPCFRILPLHFRAFIDTYNEISRRQNRPFHALLRAEHSKLLDTIVALTNSIWTLEQKETFESCNCFHHSNKDVASFDEYCYQDSRSYCHGYGPFHEIIFQAFRVIADVASDIKIGKASAIRLETGPGKHSRWPSSSSRFMPNGPAVTVAAFVTWAQLIENAKPLHALCSLSFCCPSLGPVMDGNREMLPLVGFLISQLTDSLREISPGTVSHNFKCCVEQDIISFYHIFTATWFPEQLVIAHTDQAYISALRSIYGALSNLIPLIDYYVPFQRQQVKNLFGAIGYCIYCAISPVAPLTFHSLFAATVDQKEEDNRYSMLTGLAVSIVLLRNQPNCTLVSCTQTNEDPQVHLRRCGGCHAVWYCSKACQKVDWETHKAACKHLKGLLPIAFLSVRDNSSESLKERGQMISKGIRAMGLTDEDVARLREYLHCHERDVPCFTSRDVESEEVDNDIDSGSDSEAKPDSLI